MEKILDNRREQLNTLAKIGLNESTSVALISAFNSYSGSYNSSLERLKNISRIPIKITENYAIVTNWKESINQNNGEIVFR